MSRNPFWDGPDPFGLGPDRDAVPAARPKGHGYGTWLAVIVVIVMTLLVMANAPIKAQPVPCDAQANLSPPEAKAAPPKPRPCECQSDPCSDGRCQAYGGGGDCECKTQFSLSPPVQRPLAPPVQMPTSSQVVVPQAPPKLIPTPYRQVRERVENGQKLIVLVNPPVIHAIPTRVGWTTLVVENSEIPAGRYEAFKDDAGTAKWELKESYLPPPVTAEGWEWQLAPPAAVTPLGQFRGVFRGT